MELRPTRSARWCLRATPVVGNEGGTMSDDTTTTNLSIEELSAELDKLGRLPVVATGSTDLGPAQAVSVDVDGVAYQVVEQRRRMVADVVEHAFLQDVA